MTILGAVQRIEVRILIETRSAVTAINHTLWHKISAISQLQMEKSTFREVQTASGEVVSVLGASDIEFTIGNVAYTFSRQST